MAVLYKYILKLGDRLDKIMLSYLYKQVYPISNIESRQETTYMFRADSFQMLLQKTINPKNRNNYKYILNENLISYRDTMKINRYNLYFNETLLKCVFHQDFFLRLGQISLKI